MIDWNLPLDQLPADVAFGDLPPLARELVRRNVKLRQQLQEMKLAAQNSTVATLEAELETARGRIQTLEHTLKEVEQRLEER